MPKFACIVVLAAFAATSAAAQTPVPDMRGTWKGTSESIATGGEHPHHPGQGGQAGQPRLDHIAFTMTVDMQDGRRFSGTFSSTRANDKFIAVISHNNTIYLVDDDGYTIGTMLAPNRVELCYMMRTPAVHVASCTEMTKQ
jgi:hypothetical protein